VSTEANPQIQPNDPAGQLWSFAQHVTDPAPEGWGAKQAP